MFAVLQGFRSVHQKPSALLESTYLRQKHVFLQFWLNWLNSVLHKLFEKSPKALHVFIFTIYISFFCQFEGSSFILGSNLLIRLKNPTKLPPVSFRPVGPYRADINRPAKLSVLHPSFHKFTNLQKFLEQSTGGFMRA